MCMFYIYCYTLEHFVRIRIFEHIEKYLYRIHALIHYQRSNTIYSTLLPKFIARLSNHLPNVFQDCIITFHIINILKICSLGVILQHALDFTFQITN